MFAVDDSLEAGERFGIRRCPHCDHDIRDPSAGACIYCGLPLKAPAEDWILLEIPRGLLAELAGRALESGKSGWPLVRELRGVCLAQPIEEIARWATWLVLTMLLGEICFDWSEPETFIRQIAAGSVDFDRMRDSARLGLSVKRFYADGSPQQVVINSGRTERLQGWLRDEAEAILGRYRNIEPERMQEMREKLAFSMMQHHRSYWERWEKLSTTARWLWWMVLITLLFMLLLLHYLK